MYITSSATTTYNLKKILALDLIIVKWKYYGITWLMNTWLEYIYGLFSTLSP